MHALLDFFIQLTAPLWRITRERPWTSALVLGTASVICFLLEIEFVRTILALAAAAVVISKGERIQREKHARLALQNN